MKFSKELTVALLVGSASAATVEEIINGFTSADTVKAGTASSKFYAASSLTVCANNAACTGTANEKCGTITVKGAADVKKCVYALACDGVGKAASNEFFIRCIDGAAVSSADATKYAPATMFTNVSKVIVDNAATTFGSEANVYIPSKDNFQTGWWTIDGAGKYQETDKPVLNKCSKNTDCNILSEKCMTYPDTNNKRCEFSDKCGVQQTILPMDPFTPVCEAASGGAPAGGPPISAKDDLADEAAAQAAQQLKSWEALVLKSLQEEAKYSTKTEEEKKQWDTDYAAKLAKQKTQADEWATLVGLSTMTKEQKNIWEAEQLKWKKAAFEICQGSKTVITCRDKDALRTKELTLLKAKAFWTKTAEERTAITLEIEKEVATEKKALVAAFLKKNVKAAGADGGLCNDGKCTTAESCCGTSSPSGDGVEVTNVCAKAGVWKNDVDQSFTQVCGAARLVAAAGAALAASYLM